MAPIYSHVSSEPLQYASSTRASCYNDKYHLRRIAETKKASRLLPVLPVRSICMDNPSWESLVNHAFDVSQTEPCPPNLPSSSHRQATVERERMLYRDPVNPRVVAARDHGALHESCTPTNKISSRVKPVARGEIRIPTGAPLTRQPDLNHLLSPIKLERPTENTVGEMDAPDSDFHSSLRSESSKSLLNCSPSLPRRTSVERYNFQDTCSDHSAFSKEPLPRVELESLSASNFNIASNVHCHSDIPYFNIPKRQLYYGQMPRNSKHKPLHRSTGSRHLRDQVEALGDSGKKQPLPTNQNSDDYRRSRKTSIDYFSLCRKPRLWVDASKHDERIENVHLTALIKPQRPQVVTIPRRSDSLEHQKADRSPAPYPISMSDFRSVTPPETPEIAQGFEVGAEEASEIENETQKAESLYGYGRVPLTPPNSPNQTLRTSTFYNQKITRCGSKSMSCIPYRYEPTNWILDELENAVLQFPMELLRLDSPVIRYLRLNAFKCRQVKPPSELPKTSCISVPHSRYSTRSHYSIFRPLSSHPSKGQYTKAPENVDPTRPAFLSHGDSTLDPKRENPSLNALQGIFPDASVTVLECLQATYIALHSLFAISHHHYHHPPPSKPHLSNPPPPLHLSNVPPKAREMLGMQQQQQQQQKLSNSDTYPTTWPDDPDRSDDSHPRIETLAVGLEDMARDLLGSAEGRRLDIWDEALVRTVGEVVRLGWNGGKGGG